MQSDLRPVSSLQTYLLKISILLLLITFFSIWLLQQHLLKITNYEAHQHATFCSLLLLPVSWVQIFASAQFSSALHLVFFILLTVSSIAMVCGCLKVSGNNPNILKSLLSKGSHGVSELMFLVLLVITSRHARPQRLSIHLPGNAHCCCIVYDEDLPVDFQCNIEASAVRWVVLRVFPIRNHSHCPSGKVEQ
jgi:hypothetical protein